ncbi:hypothetical protein [Marinococcus sp. PL1-022]|jgi:hypothetical protein|uniref:hypothetical protein n=1 Tax=Marinococcus sp. PL1-022 TaxID=3095363 RepID=UPI00261B295D|nr:hypothetical protein [Marinococcus sp. PL1-022]MDX6154237.1 hypothetical protein [Marinococcus sp. PL1-022]
MTYEELADRLDRTPDGEMIGFLMVPKAHRKQQKKVNSYLKERYAASDSDSLKDIVEHFCEENLETGESREIEFYPTEKLT